MWGQFLTQQPILQQTPAEGPLIQFNSDTVYFKIVSDPSSSVPQDYPPLNAIYT
jgi:hypothetical protein